MNWGMLFGSESTYYRTKRGERPLTPAQQQAILQQVQKAGGNPSVGFDRYEDVVVYREGWVEERRHEATTNSQRAFKFLCVK